VYNKLRDVVNGGVEAAEEKLGKILDILTGSAEEAKKTAQGYVKTGQDKAGEYASKKEGKVKEEL
jgi:hypothetical protein